VFRACRYGLFLLFNLRNLIYVSQVLHESDEQVEVLVRSVALDCDESLDERDDGHDGYVKSKNDDPGSSLKKRRLYNAELVHLGLSATPVAVAQQLGGQLIASLGTIVDHDNDQATLTGAAKLLYSCICFDEAHAFDVFA
jgi:hypothetical protein